FKQALLRSAPPTSARGATPASPAATHVAPVLAGVTQFYVPVGNPVRPAGPVELVYQPRVLAFAEVVFADRRKNLEFRRTYRYLGAPPAAGEPVNWHAAEPFDGSPADTPEADARWADVPESLNTIKKLNALRRDFTEYLRGNARFPL